MKKYYTELFKEEHIHNDKSTHQIHYIESIMARDGRIFYLSLGAHHTNAFYMCFGSTSNQDIISYMANAGYKPIDMLGCVVEEELCKDFGIISIHNKEIAIFETISNEQLTSMMMLYADGHITKELYEKVKSSYYTGAY